MTVEQRLLAAVWARDIERWGLWIAAHHLLHAPDRYATELLALQNMLVAALEETSKNVATVFE